MFEVTITLPTATVIRLHDLGDLKVDWASLPAAVVAQIAEVGAKTILTNVWNGGGKDASDAERHAAVSKKLDAWAKGDFNVASRSTSMESLLRDAFRLELQTQLGNPITDAAWRKFQLDSMKEAKLPVDEKKAVPFDAFIKARVAIQAKRTGGDKAELEAALMGKLTKAAEALRAEREAMLATIDTSALSI